MKHSKILKNSFVLVACTGLSACFGSTGGTGGGPGGGVSFASYQGEFDRVTNQAPTSDMPTSLQASYSGAMRADVTDGSAVVGQILADVNLDVDWTDGSSANPFSGGASNFQGTMDGGTTVGDIEGTLSVDSALPNAILRNTTTVPLPTGGTQTLNTGALSVSLAGTLTADGESVDTNLFLGGNFFGPGATAAVGTVVGGFSPEGTDPLQGIFTGGSVGGTFYLEAD